MCTSLANTRVFILRHYTLRHWSATRLARWSTTNEPFGTFLYGRRHLILVNLWKLQNNTCMVPGSQSFTVVSACSRLNKSSHFLALLIVPARPHTLWRVLVNASGGSLLFQGGGGVWQKHLAIQKLQTKHIDNRLHPPIRGWEHAATSERQAPIERIGG